MLGRSLLMKASGSLLLYPGYVQHYLDQVTATDVQNGNSQGLERGVTDALSTALQDLVADTSLGISGGIIAQAASKIKAMPFMCAARTLPGCLVPVVGPAPTRFGAEGGWNYNRKTGLAGNGIDNYLSSNRNNNADPQNNVHQSIWISSAPSAGSAKVYIGAGVTNTGTTHIVRSTAGAWGTRNRNQADNTPVSSVVTGLAAHSRSDSANYTMRANSINYTATLESQVPYNGDVFVFATNPASFYTDARLASYSIGESLDLAVLDARISTLMATLAAVIP